LELPYAARELVADAFLGKREQVRLRLVRRHAGDPLELAELVVLRVLELLLELPRMRLSIRHALLPAGELRQLPVDLLFLREHALLDLDDLGAPVAYLALDVGAELDGLLAGLDLRLAPHRLGVSAGFREEELPRAPRSRQSRA